jgi:hypothetical protein
VCIDVRGCGSRRMSSLTQPKATNGQEANHQKGSQSPTCRRRREDGLCDARGRSARAGRAELLVAPTRAVRATLALGDGPQHSIAEQSRAEQSRAEQRSADATPGDRYAAYGSQGGGDVQHWDELLSERRDRLHLRDEPKHRPRQQHQMRHVAQGAERDRPRLLQHGLRRVGRAEHSAQREQRWR